MVRSAPLRWVTSVSPRLAPSRGSSHREQRLGRSARDGMSWRALWGLISAAGSLRRSGRAVRQPNPLGVVAPAPDRTHPAGQRQATRRSARWAVVGGSDVLVTRPLEADRPSSSLTRPSPTDRASQVGAPMSVSKWVMAPALALLLMVASAIGPVAGVNAANGSSRPASSPLPVSGCIPVPAAGCGTIRVPLDRSEPGGPTIPIGYALIRHQDQSRAAIGTVVPNPGGPGASAIESAPFYTDILAPLLTDHDLLLIDPRGIGRSGPIRCGLATAPPTRDSFTRAIGECGRSLGVQARGYTSAATADDIDAVRAHLGIRRLDLLGESYGTYLMTVYAQRHPKHVRSIVLSSASPLAFDMWARPNARAVKRAILLMCQRSAGACDGPRILNQLSQLARLLRGHPVSYRVGARGSRRDDDPPCGNGSERGDLWRTRVQEDK